MSTKPISDKDFEEQVINSKIPVLVDFWAEWCGPCKVIGPILEEISEEEKDRIFVVKVNIDENPETPTKYAIRGIPTLMIFKDGVLADTKVGSSGKVAIKDWINSII
tara:strand:- start:118 stop:438 length:321 start_codon:yes stop_codon:yes gene_type:complete